MSLLVEGEKPNQMNIFKILALGFVTIIFMGIAFVLWSTAKHATVQPITETLQEQEAQEIVGVEGMLLMSLSSVATSTGQRDLFSALVSVEEKLTMRMPESNIKGEPTATLQYNVSPGVQYATFLGLPLTEQRESLGKFESWNVYRAHLRGFEGGGSFFQTVDAVSEGFAGDENDYYRERPAVSIDGDIVYASLDEQTYTLSSSSLATVPAETWNIYLITAADEKLLVSDGFAPKWINENAIAFLKNDGVYAIDLDTNLEYKVYDTTALSAVNGFDVSNDGNNFALTTPESLEMVVARVSDWAAGILESHVVVPVAASNPVFSPDSAHVAMVALRPVEGTSSEDDPIAQLEIFSLQTQDFLADTVPFDGETINGIYLTDWQ